MQVTYMTDECTGSCSFEPRYSTDPSEMTANDMVKIIQSLNSDEYADVDDIAEAIKVMLEASSKRLYHGDICVNCGKFVTVEGKISERPVPLRPPAPEPSTTGIDATPKIDAPKPEYRWG